jgi:hypothetical protein
MPVALRPGCEEAVDKALPTGSTATVKTTGMVLVASSGGAVVAALVAMISEFSASSSAICLRISAVPGGTRQSGASDCCLAPAAPRSAR